MSANPQTPDEVYYFYCEQVVPRSGIYEASHVCGRDAHDITLIRAQRFPACPRCGYAMSFRWLRRADHPEKTGIVLNYIPE